MFTLLVLIFSVAYFRKNGIKRNISLDLNFAICAEKVMLKGINFREKWG